jgi:hypothetical protein
MSLLYAPQTSLSCCAATRKRPLSSYRGTPRAQSYPLGKREREEDTTGISPAHMGSHRCSWSELSVWTHGQILGGDYCWGRLLGCNATII